MVETSLLNSPQLFPDTLTALIIAKTNLISSLSVSPVNMLFMWSKRSLSTKTAVSTKTGFSAARFERLRSSNKLPFLASLVALGAVEVVLFFGSVRERPSRALWGQSCGRWPASRWLLRTRTWGLEVSLWKRFGRGWITKKCLSSVWTRPRCGEKRFYEEQVGFREQSGGPSKTEEGRNGGR